MICTRIVERTNVNGRVSFVIQQPWFIYSLYIWIRTLFNSDYTLPNFMWCDAWMNSWDAAGCTDSFHSLEAAQNNLCYFDGSKSSDKIL